MDARARFLLIAAISLSGTIPANVHAEDFTVQVRVQCPAYFKAVGTGPTGTGPAVTAVDPYLLGSETVPDLAPCANIKIEARDSDVGRDDHCGSGYADSAGRIEFSATCGDPPGGGRPEVYLQIYAKSAHGWEITKYDGWEAILGTAGTFVTAGAIGELDDALTASDPYKVTVTSEKHPGNGDNLNYGTVALGDLGDSIQSRREFVGTLFFLSDVSMRTLKAIGYDSPLIHDTNWVIDSLIGYPTTIWNQIIIDSSVREGSVPKTRGTLRSAPHEFGHVFHNKRHSGVLHWLGIDATEYMHKHSRCSKHNGKMAWYEGFANLVRDIVFDAQSTVDNFTDATGALVHTSLWDPFRIDDAESQCDELTTAIEGNIQAILVDLYFGNFDERSSTAQGVFHSERLHSNLNTHRTQAVAHCATTESIMPTLRPTKLMGLIAGAREAKENGQIADNHRIYDYWAALIAREDCPDGNYCKSVDFRERSARVLPDAIGFQSTPAACNTLVAPVPTEPQPPKAIPAAADYVVSERAAKNLMTRAQARQRARLETVPRKEAVRKRMQDLNVEADWYQYGISPAHIADVDFAATPRRTPRQDAISPHVTTAIKWLLHEQLGRAPTQQEIQRRAEEDDARIGRLNRALNASQELRKAHAAGDAQRARQIESALIASALGSSKADGEEAPDDSAGHSKEEERALRGRLIARLINDQYGR